MRDRFSGRGNLRLPTRFFSSFSAQVYDYTYDTAGNIRTVAEDGVVTQTYSYSTGDWKDLLVSVNGNSISYDGAGNPISYPRFEDGVDYYMVWNQGRQLTYLDYATAADNETQIYYSYDADGIRTSKTVTKGTTSTATTTHSYITQNGKVVRETIGTGATAKVLDFIYDADGRPFALRYSTNGGSSFTIYYYVLNLQGDVVALMTENRTIVAKYSYNAWGEILAVTDSNDNIITSATHIGNLNPLRYRGYYYDTETNFYYLQSRYYDPTIHRFISADSYTSTGQGFVGYNMFAYCNNNPVIYFDATGSSAMRNIGTGADFALYGGGGRYTGGIPSSPRTYTASTTKTGSNRKGWVEVGGVRGYLKPAEEVNEEITRVIDFCIEMYPAYKIINGVRLVVTGAVYIYMGRPIYGGFQVLRGVWSIVTGIRMLL